MSSFIEAPSEAPAASFAEPEWENYRLHRRFDRMGRLVGDSAMSRLFSSHVLVVGLGGVGSWAAEAIARAGVGEISIVDFDEICVTNFNRQVHSLQGLVGKKKADVMAERIQKINPKARIRSHSLFYNAENRDDIFAQRPDFVIDAIDSITSKCHLLAHCHGERIPVITSTGSGGRMDPLQVKVTDLAFTTIDPLARDLRRILRSKYGFPSDEKTPFGIPAIYSTEIPRRPEELHYDGGKGFRCVCPQGDNPYFTCDNRNLIMGNAGFVTGNFGLVAAAKAVEFLLS